MAASVMPTMPETIRLEMEMMVVSLILRFLNRYALGAMLMLEMTNPKKERRDSGISSGVS